MMGSITNTDRDEAHRRRVRAVCWLAVLAVVLVGAALVPALTVAEETNETTPSNLSEEAPYYADQDPDPGLEEWLADREDPTLENTIHMASRVGTYVIGGEPGTSSGPLLVGVLAVGAIIGMTMGTGVGLVGGAVIAVMSAFGIVAIDVAPEWLYAVALFAVGWVMASVAKSILR